MKIAVYDPKVFKNGFASTAQKQGSIVKQPQEGKSVFQQLLQTEQMQASNTEGESMLLPPIGEAIAPSASGTDHDDMTMAWLEAFFPLLSPDMQQMLQEQLGGDSTAFPSIDPQDASTIKQLAAEWIIAMQQKATESTENMQPVEQLASWQQNIDSAVDMPNIEQILAILKRQRVQQANVGFSASAKQDELARMSNVSQISKHSNPTPFAQSLPFQLYKLPIDSKLSSLTQTAEQAKQKQDYAEVMNPSLMNALHLTAASQQKAPVISLEEGQTARNVNEQFVHQFSDIIRTSKFTKLGNGQSQLVIRLHPEHLGTLTVKLVQERGEMMAKIIASSASAKELVEANIQQISHIIPAQHITVEQFDILNHEAMPRYDQTFGDQERNRGGQQQEQRQPLKQEKELHFQDALTNELLNIEA
ncbi:flagellar hook-length control protein FliK [Anoxybacillus tepidamans]|uniref:flagellar hook-length control protein FliK n=1 Tax=Anoxybacteroides tepidamans TaxID=265948 RepID=UPI0004882919|nr:flagellar hook-length control protein FliK [Anoxybacillus tepidamans]